MAQAAVVAAIRELVHRAAPEVRESVKWAQPVWKMNGPVCSAKAFKNHTNVNFWRGAELAERADPDGILSGAGDKMRHVGLAGIDDIRPAAFTRLVQVVVELNRKFGDPTRGDATRARG